MEAYTYVRYQCCRESRFTNLRIAESEHYELRIHESRIAEWLTNLSTIHLQLLFFPQIKRLESWVLFRELMFGYEWLKRQLFTTDQQSMIPILLMRYDWIHVFEVWFADVKILIDILLNKTSRKLIQSLQTDINSHV